MKWTRTKAALMICLSCVFLAGCATTGTTTVIDLGNEVIGDIEQAPATLERACKTGPFHWGYLDGSGLLAMLPKQVGEDANKFQSFCDRREGLTSYEIGYALGLYQRIAYLLMKGAIVKVIGIVSPAMGGLPAWVP